MQIELKSLGAASVLGLMLKEMLARNANDPWKCAVLSGLQATVLLRAGSMDLSLYFEGERIRIEDGRPPRPEVEIAGDMGAFLKMGVGGNPIIPFLTRQLSFRGHPLTALKLLAGLRLGPRPWYFRWWP